MKSLIKPLILSTALSTLGLCFTISHASSEQLNSLNKPATSAAHAYVYAFPLLESEGNSNKFNNNNLIISELSQSLGGDSTSIGDLLNNPLLIIPNETSPRDNGQDTKHNFFEMSALFNDKLQSLLAYFHSSENIEITGELESSSTALTSNCKS